MKKNNQAHEFALFVDAKNISVNVQAHSLMLKDSDIINRIVTVLRLTVGEHVTLFDHKVAYGCTIDEITKKHIKLSIRHQRLIELQPPVMDVVVPLLDREALEDVVYMATVYGARKVYLIATEKSRKQLTEKDLLRLHKISISAAEQSKQFCLPVINHVSNKSHVLSVETFITQHAVEYKDSIKLWCDVTGTPVLEHLTKVAKPYNNYLVTFGPEGDFTHQEKEFLATMFTPIKLSNSILRAKDAASLIMGIVK